MEDLAERTWELTSFLVDVMNYQGKAGQPSTDLTYTYHDSCAGLREMGVKSQPRQLLHTQRGIELAELHESEVCCGFGGTFCAKMPALSGKMVDDKLENVKNTGADVLVGGDLGCLLNIKGRASRLGQAIEVRHVAEVLTGRDQTPGIGEPDS